MSFVNKKTRLFLDRGDLKPLRRRSESRLKTYRSAEDLRTWCGQVEDRRQHILELVTLETKKCLGNIVPIDVLVNILMEDKNSSIGELKKCLEQLWKFVEGCSLGNEDMRKLVELKDRMSKICLDSSKSLGSEATFRMQGSGAKFRMLGSDAKIRMAQSETAKIRSSTGSECPAKQRHEREKTDLESFRSEQGLVGTGRPASRGTYDVKAKGPAKITTKLKMKPGEQVSVGKITVKAQGPYRNKANMKKLREEDTGDEKGNHTPEEVQKLLDQLAARDALCEEQQNSIENLRSERDKLNSRIQDCLGELEALKKLNNVSDPGVPTSCKEEIEALEQEMQVMRSGNLSPEQEAEVIKKEVEILKKYCLKLKAMEEENELLKSHKDPLSGDNNTPTIDLVTKMKQLQNERDELMEKLKKVESQSLEYTEIPEDIEVYKNRSDMLDKALAERDDMQRKLDKMKAMENQLEELKEKAARADELEKTLKYYNKNDRTTDYELKRTQSKCICLEKELHNHRSEKDAMSKRIELMSNELESLRSKGKEAEMLKLERDRLQIKLNELSHVQVHNENLMLKCKCLESAAIERDAYKLKYEEILGMECQCEMMKLKIEESRNMQREKDTLVKQVMDLESCIKDQEDEIKRLVAQIDNMIKNKDETQSRMKDALANMRAEVDKKDQLIAASEEKLAAVQKQLKSSIQGVSCETTCYKTRIEELERELCAARCRIGKLERQLTEKEEILRGAKKTNKSEYESVAIMKKELEAAKAENNKLQEIANKMVTLTGDEHVQKMLRQSECAVRRVVEELGKQYREWDHMRRQKKGSPARSECMCKSSYAEEGSDFESADEKLKEELREIQREKEKLESIVKQIQNGDGPQKETVTVKMENEKLQQQLQEEIAKRRGLEQKLNKILGV